MDQTIRRFRNDKIDGIGPWVWLATDDGAWDGPVQDWPAHRDLWLKVCGSRLKTCVQAGGCQGLYPRLLANHFQTVVTFEPDPDSFEVLKQNCLVEGNIVAYNIGLSSKPGRLHLDMTDKNNVGTHRITFNDNQEPNIDVVTLDDMAIVDVDFIQLDVEDFEYNVLIGARQTIANYLPVISCEKGHGGILDILRPFGYQIIGQTGADTTYAVVR